MKEKKKYLKPEVSKIPLEASPLLVNASDKWGGGSEQMGEDEEIELDLED